MADDTRPAFEPRPFGGAQGVLRGLAIESAAFGHRTAAISTALTPCHDRVIGHTCTKRFRI